MSLSWTLPPKLPGWLHRSLTFERRAALVDGQLVHFLDHRCAAETLGHPVLLVHGNPTWSFLWRQVIRALCGAGVRVVAPDLVGFGLSSKPRSVSWHSLERHIHVVHTLAQALGLEHVTVVGQDWGGPVAAAVAARLEAARPGTVTGAVFANTSLLAPRSYRGTSFHRLARAPVVSDLLFRGLGFPLSVLHTAQGDRGSIGRFERRAYRMPFRNPLHRAGPLALARMVPDGPAHPSVEPLQRVDAWVRGFQGPLKLVWGTRDPLLGRALGRHAKALPQAQVVETRAGHFLQEEVPDALAQAIVDVSPAAPQD